MKLLIWNINSLIPTVRNFVLKHGSLRGFFDAEPYQADIVCFQETKLIDEKLTKDLACVDGFQSFWAISREKKGYSGVVTFASEAWAPLAADIDCLGNSAEDPLNREGRIVVTDHGVFVLLNVYVPNAGKHGEELSPRADLKIRFLHALKAKCDSLMAQGRQVMIVGDLNVAAGQRDVHSGLDWSKMYHPEEKAIMTALLQDYTDVWRMQHPGAENIFTVWDERTNARFGNKGVRIDYVLVSRGLLPHCGPCTVIDTPPKWSDHSALHIEFHGLSPPEPHPPAALWSKCLQRFTNPSQPSVASFFGRKTAKALQAPSSEAKEVMAKVVKLEQGGSATRVSEQCRKAAAEDACELRPLAALETLVVAPSGKAQGCCLASPLASDRKRYTASVSSGSGREAEEEGKAAPQMAECLEAGLRGSAAEDEEAHPAKRAKMEEQDTVAGVRDAVAGRREIVQAEEDAGPGYAIPGSRKAVHAEENMPAKECAEDREVGALLADKTTHKSIGTERKMSSGRDTGSRKSLAMAQSRKAGEGMGRSKGKPQSRKAQEKIKGQLGIKAFLTNS